jgi:hypothetical protein
VRCKKPRPFTYQPTQKVTLDIVISGIDISNEFDTWGYTSALAETLGVDFRDVEIKGIVSKDTTAIV